MLKCIIEIPKNITVYLIQIYRNYLSPLKLCSCRFYPSCSEYALESVKKHGFLSGCLLAVKRLVRCHPFSHGGYDPIE